MSDFFKKFSPVFIIISLFFGGLGGQSLILLALVTFWFTLFFFDLARKKHRISFPPGFMLYILFLVLFTISLFWSKEFWPTYWYLLIFSCGAFYWLSTYNLKNEFKYFENIVILIALIFGILATINFHLNPQVIDSYSLHKMVAKSNFHIGDFWAAILCISIYRLILISKKNEFKRRLFWLFLLLIGTYIIFISKSRTAVISLIVGILYLLKYLKIPEKYWRLLIICICLAVFFFLFFARTKPIFMHRIYYLQGLIGLVHNPFGVGVGNFGLLSSDSANYIFGLHTYSAVADNIILEMFAGMGIFGIIFLIWFVKVIESVQKNRTNKNLIPRIVFIVLTTNFLFYLSYLIPATLWIWFISLGYSQKKPN